MSSTRKDGRVAARPSATIMVLREAADLPEVLMVRRRAGDAFGNSFAFPGGVVDADECTATELCTGVSSEEANRILGVVDGGADYYCAGIRELFEETRILLAKDASGCWANTGPEIDEQRLAVDKGKLPWSTFLQQHGLTMAYDALHYFAHWETPICRAKRWTTRFFVTELPAGQDASHDGYETTDCQWLQAKHVLEKHAAGQIKLPHPTQKSLERIQEMHTVDEVIAWADTEQLNGIAMHRLVMAKHLSPA